MINSPKETRPVEPEFSRRHHIGVDAGHGMVGKEFAIEANAQERAALAARFGLLSVDSLHAEGTTEAVQRGRRAWLKARITADVTQACVVTLEPVKDHIEEVFERVYEKDLAEPAGEVIIAADEGDEPPEPLPDDGVIDIGEAVAEHLGLSLNPYPRAPESADVQLNELNEEKGTESPFSALSRLKRP